MQVTGSRPGRAAPLPPDERRLAILKAVLPVVRLRGADVTTREGVTARAEIELRLFAPGEVEHMAWAVDGLPVTRIRTEREDSFEASAACLFARIPDVAAARPGIVLLSEMGPIRHHPVRAAVPA